MLFSFRENSAIGRLLISILPHRQVADIAYGIQTGSGSAFRGDFMNALSARIPLGSGFAAVSKRQQGGPSMSEKSLKTFSNVGDAAWGLAADATLPEVCK